MNIREMTYEEILKKDLEYCEHLINENKEYIHYDNEAYAWFIGDTEIVDELWYECNTIIHPKILIDYINKILEKEMNFIK